MPRQTQSRDFLARKLRQNWMSKFPDNSNRSTTVATGVREVDDSLTNLNWLQNMNLMKMTSPAPPPLSPPPDGTLGMRRSISYDPSGGSHHLPPLSTVGMGGMGGGGSQQFPPETIEQVDEADILEYRTNPMAKPHFSYASLICMAMRDLNKTKVALTDIYEWVMDNFIYYRIAEPSWQNSIRHNLSLNKCFQKVPRRKDEPGKGGFWRLNPDYQRVLDSVTPSSTTTKRRRNSHANSNSSGGVNNCQNDHMGSLPAKRQRPLRMASEVASLQYDQYELHSHPHLHHQTSVPASILPNHHHHHHHHSQQQHHQTSTPLPMMSAAFHHQLHPGLQQQHPAGGGYSSTGGGVTPTHYSDQHLNLAAHHHHQLMSPATGGGYHHHHQQTHHNHHHQAHHQDDVALTAAMLSATNPGLPPLTRGNGGGTSDVDDANAVLNDFLSGNDLSGSIGGGGVGSGGVEDPRYPPMDLTTQGDPLDLTIQGVGLKPPEWWSQSLDSSSGAQLLAAARLDVSQNGGRGSLAPSPLLLEEDQQWVDEQLNLEELDTILGLS